MNLLPVSPQLLKSQWIDWKSLKNKLKPQNNSNNQRLKEDKRKANNKKNEWWFLFI
jgi:hypothetical protein